MKYFSLLFATCSLALFVPVAQADDRKEDAASVDLYSGNYLISRFAQKHHDWDIATAALAPLIQNGIASEDLLHRAMILSLGSGNIKNALSVAKYLDDVYQNESNTVIDILRIADAIKRGDFDQAEVLFDNTPKDATLNFIGPFLKGWIKAGQGEMDISALQGSTAQLYHAILISDFMDDYSKIKAMIDKTLMVEDITSFELERIADLYAHVGHKDKALELYQKILPLAPDQSIIEKKINRLNSKEIDPLFQKIKTAQHGAAQAFTDISRILHQDGNDETARVFAHLGRYIAPDLNSSAFLIASIYAQNQQYEDAIEIYKDIANTHEADFMRAQLAIADIYQDMARYDAALVHLQKLEKKYSDADVIIKIGDLHRAQSNFKMALKAYNRAVDKLKMPLPDQYWHLHYARGIAYEQTDNWARAEEELKAALSHQPDHPYVLNYLGYSWADQGINLPEALAMIRKAVQLRPSDGYITDSLGWVLYKTKDYHNAVTALERAVELLPYDPTVNDHLGDAYWKVGRYLEARFQWERAKNHSEDSEQIEIISKKLISGLES